MDRLTLGDKLVAGGGLLFLVLSFIPPWAKIEVEGFGGAGGSFSDFSAWDYGILLKGALILAIVYAGAVIAKAFGVELPAMPAVSNVALGGAIVVLFLLQVLLGPPDDGGGFFGVEISRGLMMFIAIIPVAAIGYGSYLKMSEEGGSVPQYGGTTPTAPPPPPAP